MTSAKYGWFFEPTPTARPTTVQIKLPSPPIAESERPNVRFLISLHIFLLGKIKSVKSALKLKLKRI